MYRRFAIILIVWVLAIAPVYAGWTEEVRLTNRHFEIYPQVSARGDTIHVVWQQIAGPMHISYMRSTDGGHEWDSFVNLEEIGHYGYSPDLSLFPDGIFIGWFDEDTSNATSYIAFSRSLDGSNWSVPEYMTNDIIRLYSVGATAFADSIYAVYHSRDHDSTGANPLRFLYSSDMGATWSDEVTVGHVHSFTNFLHMTHCRSSLYIVWASDLAPLGVLREVMAVVSHDGGQSWSEVMQLSSPDTAVAQLTCIACDEESGNFAVGWMDEGSWHHYPGDLYVRLTTDGGYTWMPESHTTYDRWVFRSSLNIKGDSLWAVWEDRDPAYGQGNYEICFSQSTDLGTSWSPYERLTFEPENSKAPGIAYDGGKLHVVWHNDNPPPEGGKDIYYKRFEPETGIDGDLDRNVPDRITLFAYPNPFNSSVLLNYSNLKGGEINIYDIQGKLIRTFSLEGGENEKIKWDARDALGNKVSSGIYFARAKTSQSSQVVKLIYLK
jgi:hypothetical protein